MSRRGYVPNEEFVLVGCGRVLAAGALILMSGICESAQSDGVRPPAREVAHTRKVIAGWITEFFGAPAGSRSAKSWERLHHDTASKIKPDDFNYLIAHDPDADFRRDAIAQFANLVTPQRTLSTLARVARTDPDSGVRFMATAEIYLNYGAGLLRGRRDEVERLAMDCINMPRQRLFAIQILGYCRTARGDKELRNVLSEDSVVLERRAATQGLQGKFHVGDLLRPPSIRK
jgi:hypothetical protein